MGRGVAGASSARCPGTQSFLLAPPLVSRRLAEPAGHGEGAQPGERRVASQVGPVCVCEWSRLSVYTANPSPAEGSQQSEAWLVCARVRERPGASAAEAPPTPGPFNLFCCQGREGVLNEGEEAGRARRRARAR